VQSREPWELAALERLKQSGETGAGAVDFIVNRNIRLSFARQVTGARWNLLGMMGVAGKKIQLNSAIYSPDKVAADVGALALIAHEAKHFEQGGIRALSVYGELEAWQVQTRVAADIGGPLTEAMRKIADLPLNHQRDNLKLASELMREHDPRYRSHLLPLNPIFKR
jgi:hypothetical protein